MCHIAGLEVNVRRAYKAYTLLNVDYEEGDGLDDGMEPHAVTWRFKLGQKGSVSRREDIMPNEGRNLPVWDTWEIQARRISFAG